MDESAKLGRVLLGLFQNRNSWNDQIILLFRPELITNMSEPVNSVTMKVLQPLWNQSSPRTNNCLAYSNYSYSGIGLKECTLIILISTVVK